MEIYKHKASGKYFIFIDYVSQDSALFVNPIAKIMELELAQFDDESLENTGDYFVDNGFITEELVNHYQMYQDFRKQDAEAKNNVEVEAFFEGMSREGLEAFISRIKERLNKKE